MSGAIARPRAEWHEDDGPALWWKFPVEEPPYAGSPLDDGFPDYVTHWTPIDVPQEPTEPVAPGGRLHVALWDAISNFARAYGSTERQMSAVPGVEEALRDVLAATVKAERARLMSDEAVKRGTDGLRRALGWREHQKVTDAAVAVLRAAIGDR